jgi:hypothetical protein
MYALTICCCCVDTDILPCSVISEAAALAKKLDPKNFICQKLVNAVVIKSPGSINGQQFIIEDCKVRSRTVHPVLIRLHYTFVYFDRF